MKFVGRSVALAALIAVAAVAAGCGDSVIDDAKTEGALEQNLRGSLDRKVASVECPSGVEVEPRTSFDCAVTLVGGRTETATLRILNEDADVEVTGLSPKK